MTHARFKQKFDWSDSEVREALDAFCNHPAAKRAYARAAPGGEVLAMRECAMTLLARRQIFHIVDEHDYASEFLNRIDRKNDATHGHPPVALYLALIETLFDDAFSREPKGGGNGPHNEWIENNGVAIRWFERGNNADRAFVCDAAGLSEAYVLRKYAEFKADPARRVALIAERLRNER